MEVLKSRLDVRRLIIEQGNINTLNSVFFTPQHLEYLRTNLSLSFSVPRSQSTVEQIKIEDALGHLFRAKNQQTPDSFQQILDENLKKKIGEGKNNQHSQPLETESKELFSRQEQELWGL